MTKPKRTRRKLGTEARLKKYAASGMYGRIAGKPKKPLPGLRVTEVKYRTNRSVGEYRHKHLEATAKVGPNEDPAVVLARLKSWVHMQLAEAAGQGADFSSDLDDPF